MNNSLSAPGLCVAVALHAIALGALLFAGSESETVSASDADPILLMLGGEDPNKDAGLVGRERGVARGTQDGTIADPRSDTSRLDAIRKNNERLAREEAEAAQRAEEEAEKQAKRDAERKAAAAAEAQRKAEAAAQKRAADKDKPKAPEKPNNTPGKGATQQAKPTPSGGSIDISKLVQSNRQKGLYNTNGSSGSSRSSVGKGTKRIGEVKIGGVGGGSVLGKPDGTGENGGDGGKRVADARMTYVNAVRARFVIHFENVVDQNPPSIPNSVSINARFSVSKNGDIQFLSIEGSSNAQIRECIRNTFKRAFPSRFQRPPNGEAFTGRLDNIEFLAQ